MDSVASIVRLAVRLNRVSPERSSVFFAIWPRRPCAGGSSPIFIFVPARDYGDKRTSE